MGYGLFPLSQLEIEILYGDVPIKAHLDFTLIATQPQPTVRILGVKSTGRLSVTLSGSRSAVRRYCSKPIGTSRFSISFRKRGKFFITRSSLKCVTNVLEYPFLMLQLVTFKGGFSVSPCAMPKPLARFFLKIRITPGVWIWLPSSGKP